MTITPTPLADLVVIEPKVFGDDRGWFYESYNQEVFAASGIDAVFVQDNHSFSQAGVLRGLHFQRPPHAQAKLVRCTRGRLWDVAVDLRQDSPTYAQWFGLELSADNHKQLFVPAGFAHGFYALEDCELQYKCSDVYNQLLDGAIIWNDPDIAIDWPLLDQNPVVSEKDAAAATLSAQNLPF